MGFDEWLSHDNYFDPNPVLSRNGEAPQKFAGEGSGIIIREDFAGTRAMTRDQFKLMVEGRSPNEKGWELYDIGIDPGETKNLADEHPEIVEGMPVGLRKWQESVLNSLTGADYK